MRTLAATSVARWCLIAIATLGLSACGGNMDDLNEYIDTIKAKPGARPDPLPEIKPYETFVYRADENGARSPFQPEQKQASVAGGGIRPSPADRPREYLESVPIDSLKMVGTVGIDGRNYGLLKDPDGLVHRVLPGNFVGQNDGRVQSITSAEIKLLEIVSDGIGGYIEREAAISLND